jgi:hypothetical protein
MIIIVIGHELENQRCTRFTDRGHFKEWISSMDKEKLKDWLLSDSSEIYFINVSNKIWNEFKTKNAKRLELTLDEINELRQKASFLFLIKKNYVESCMYYPKDDDP